MGLFSFIRGEFIEVIDWKDDTQDTMVYKFPVETKQQIKNGAQLIVAPSQTAIFVYEGQIVDTYAPGKYTLSTNTMPIMTSLSNWKYALENHFKTDVYFINTKQFINQKWGTTNPIMMRDQDFGMLRVRGFGIYSFKVSDVVVFLKEVLGSNKLFTTNQINEHLKSIIVSTASDVIAESNIPAMDLSMHYEELSAKIMGNLDSKFSSYGLMVSDFAVENLSLPESVEKAIDKRTEMGAIGNLNEYMKYQAAESMRDAAQNEGSGMAGMGVGMGAGLNMSKMMMDASANTNDSNETRKNTIKCNQCGEEIQAGIKFCSKCGNKLMNNCIKCNHELQLGAKFCTECGANQVEVKTCLKCGEELPSGTKFCPKCGEAL